MVNSNRVLKNQNGMALILTVLMTATVLLTTLGAMYLYTVNRAKYHQRIKEAYKMMNVTETAAKAIKAQWDQTASGLMLGPTPTPPPPDAVVSAINLATWPVPSTSCTSGCPGGAPAPNICVENPDNPSLNYCLYKGTFTSQLEFRLYNPLEHVQPGKIEKFIARLDDFFDDTVVKATHLHMTTVAGMRAPRFWGWIINESQAFANLADEDDDLQDLPGPLPNNNIIPDLAAWCNTATNPGCVPCGYGSGANYKAGCAVIYACPYSWDQCQYYSGGPTGALFVQQIRIPMPGDQR